ELRALALKRMRERARLELGQPAKVTLDALIALDHQAQELGSAHERVALLMMCSQTYARLGDHDAATRIAQDCVRMAAELDDATLIADAWNRLGNSMAVQSPAEARPAYAQALALYESIGDVRGLARCYRNLGIAAQFEAKLDEAEQAFTRAMTVARAAGIPDICGMSGLNLGVRAQKRGDYDRARELFGDALALCAAAKHSEFQLVALYNMAHVERELGLWET